MSGVSFYNPSRSFSLKPSVNHKLFSTHDLLPSKKRKNHKYESVCNRKENLIAFQDDTIIPFNVHLNEIATNTQESLRIGEYYSLTPKSCDGVDNESSVYQVHGIVKQFNGFDINCAVVKQVDGKPNRIFSLNRSQCTDLNIPFVDGLQLLPLSLSWTRVDYENKEKQKEFNPNDLSTFRTNYGYLTSFTAKLTGFRSYAIGQIITPNDVVMSTKEFKVSLKCFIVKGDKPFDTPFSIITRQVIGGNTDILCDNNGNIYVAIDVRQFAMKPEDVVGQSLSDICYFTWVEKLREEAEETEWDEGEQFGVSYDPFGISHEAMKAVDGLIRTIDGTTAEVYMHGRWNPIDVNKIDMTKIRPLTDEEWENSFK